MGDKLVDGLSGTEEGEGETSHPSYGEIFEDLCPYYLQMGMSYEDFWDGDCEKAKYYRKKWELDNKKINYYLWLLGGYVYEVVADLVPLLNPFCKDHTAIPYRSEPLPLTKKDAEAAKEREQRKQLEAAKNTMMEFMAANNRRFKNDRT